MASEQKPPPTSGRWLEVKTLVAREAYEAVSWFLMEDGAHGVWEASDGIVAYFPVLTDEDSNGEESDAGGDADRADRGDDSDDLSLIDDHRARLERLQQFLQHLPDFGLNPGDARVMTSVRGEEDWAEAWKAHYHPIPIGRHIVICPTWQTYDPRPDDIVVHLDPGMAFGTGKHESTRLCIQLLEDAVRPGDVVLDVGTGSGILSIVAARLGARHVVGVDIDPVAVRVARQNAEANDVHTVMDMHVGGVEALAVVETGTAHVLVANITADVIADMAPSFDRYVRKTGTIIVSGIVRDKQTLVEDAFARLQWHVQEARVEGEWVALAMNRGDAR